MTDSCNMSKVSQKVTNNRRAISPQLFIITFRRVLWDRDADTNHLTINNFYRLIIILSMKHEMESFQRSYFQPIFLKFDNGRGH